MNETLEQFQSAIHSITTEVEKVIIGQAGAVRQCLIVILANQHGLIEGVPGVAKTLLARTLARAMNCEFGRIVPGSFMSSASVRAPRSMENHCTPMARPGMRCAGASSGRRKVATR